MGHCGGVHCFMCDAREGVVRTLYCVKDGAAWRADPKLHAPRGKAMNKAVRHDFGSIESARAFVRENWGRVVVVRIYRKGKR